MSVIHTTMGFFARPGNSYIAQLAAEGWQGVSLPVTPGMTRAQRHDLLMEHARAIEYLVIDTTPVDRAFIEAATRLKHVAMFGVGTDHIDIQAATEHGVLVTRALGGNTRSVAELALAFIFALARHIVPMNNTMTAGSWKPLRGSELYGKTLGILGLGAIGSELARMGAALGMQVAACSRTPKKNLAAAIGCMELPLNELLATADYLVLCVPGDGGQPLIGAAELALMKKTARLVNVSRGTVLDLDALTAAISNGALACAALDVYPQEPMAPAHPVFALPGVIHSPHVGANTAEAIDNVFALCFEDAVLRRQGRQSPRAVNPQVYTRG